MSLLLSFLASMSLALPLGSPAATSAQSVPAPVPVPAFDAARADVQMQVRIEQRVVIRISPPPAATRQRAFAEVPRRRMNARFQERPLRGCVKLSHIVGSQPLANNRLLLFMRDRGILTISLDRLCSAQSFYSGFYVERSGDGLLCPGRDTIRSRSGMTCQIGGVSRLVAIRD